jgi:outer membrane protein assembly factor BamB
MNSGFRSLALAAGLLLLLPKPGHTQEWTRFRGPNGSGISAATTVPVQFTEADYNWKIQLPGVGHSSPVLWGKRLFLTSAEEVTGKRHVLGVNASDGKIVWDRSYDFSGYKKHTLNSFASGTPAVDADGIYFTWTTAGALTALALDHNGKDLWSRDLGKYDAMHGGAGSPIVVGEIVIVTNDQDGEGSFLAGLDRKTGEVRWKRPRNSSASAAYSTPLVYQPKDGPPEVIFTSTSHGVTSLDPRTGDLNWEVPNLFRARCVGSPILAKGLVFGTAGTGGGEKQAVAVRPGSKRDGTAPKVEYQVARGISYVPTPIASGDLLFLWGDAGVVTCLRAATGEQVWMERVGGNFYGSPVCVNGKLYAVGAQGEVVVVEASDQFKVLGRSILGERSNATPAVADGVMYFRTESHLISVGGKK